MQSENNQVLGSYPISALRKILDYIEEKRGVKVDIGRIPLDNRETLELFKRGDTNGVFGFSSPDIQKYSKELKPNSFDELMILCAFCGPARTFRPSDAEMITEYIDRKSGELEYDGIHLDVEPIILPTCCIFVYHEQVT